MDENVSFESGEEWSQADQYLTYTVGEEAYGIRILSVREIRGWEPVARIPNAPNYVKGILNLRGTAVPVIDMRMRLNIVDPVYDITTVLIVVRSQINGIERIAGIVVDSVSDVMNARSDEILGTPDFGDNVDTAFIHGLIDVDGKMVMIFDVDSFMKHPDIYNNPFDDE